MMKIVSSSSELLFLIVQSYISSLFSKRFKRVKRDTSVSSSIQVVSVIQSSGTSFEKDNSIQLCLVGGESSN